MRNYIVISWNWGIVRHPNLGHFLISVAVSNGMAFHRVVSPFASSCHKSDGSGRSHVTLITLITLIESRVTEIIAQECAIDCRQLSQDRDLKHRTTGPRVLSAFGSGPRFPVFRGSHTRSSAVRSIEGFRGS